MPRTQTDQTVEVIAGLTMDKLVLFMAYVINCADQVKQKTEKIKIIVRAAEKYLGVKDVSWEQVNRKLEGDGR